MSFSTFVKNNIKTKFQPASTIQEVDDRLKKILLDWTLEQKNDLLELAQNPKAKTQLKTAKKWL